MTFQLDTTGDVGPMPAGPMNERFVRWSDLSPFTQGYVEALPWDALAAEARNHWFVPDHRLSVGFSSLAPETLARIIADCGAFAAPFGPNPELSAKSGALFFEGRQKGECDEWPPLTVQLGDDGKVRFTA